MNVRFEAADGTRLEGVVLDPSGDAMRVAVVCHPHPQYGGSMDTWMPPVLQRALVDDGWTALRFNFRGVGGSGGSYEGGGGEVADVLGAISFVLDHVDALDAPVLVTGWSFGALVGLAAALRDDRVVGWAGVAPPVGLMGTAGIGVPGLDRDALAAWEHPTCWIIGSHDQISSVEQVRDVAAAAGERATVEVVEGDHFLLGRGDEISRLVTVAARRAVGGDA